MTGGVEFMLASQFRILRIAGIAIGAMTSSTSARFGLAASCIAGGRRLVVHQGNDGGRCQFRHRFYGSSLLRSNGAGDKNCSYHTNNGGELHGKAPNNVLKGRKLRD